MSPLSTILRMLLLVLPVSLGYATMPGGGLGGPSLARLGPQARALVERAFADLPADSPLVDFHAHLVGLGTDDSGLWVNPARLSPRHPGRWLQTRVYFGATRVKDRAHFDAAYLERLVLLARGFGRPVRIHLLAMDRAYSADGTVDLERTEFYVPNEAVVKASELHPDLFVPVVSIHPARADALPELRRWAARGVRWVKWLPNAQAIDPADPRHAAFYVCMRDLGMTLLTHVGEEKAVAVKDAQSLGNPLRFRPALDLGLRVVMAHCASLGSNEDLDHPGRRATNFELFLRLLAEPRYQDLLFGDISALTQFNRMPEPMLELLRRPDLQSRLVQGSDYPLPAVDVLVWTRQMLLHGLITRPERMALNEIFRANPLLFDFVLKRTLRDRASGRRLRPEIFLGTALTAPPGSASPGR